MVAKREKKWKMTWELRELLPADVHEMWDRLPVGVRDLIARTAFHAKEVTDEAVRDSMYDSMAGVCDREHVDD